VCRRLAEDPRVGGLTPDLAWDFPLRLLGGLHYLVLRGDASWDDLDAAFDEHTPFLARWTAEQDVQTNEVQRSWALLPGFLVASDERPLDLLVELDHDMQPRQIVGRPVGGEPRVHPDRPDLA